MSTLQTSNLVKSRDHVDGQPGVQAAVDSDSIDCRAEDCHHAEDEWVVGNKLIRCLAGLVRVTDRTEEGKRDRDAGDIDRKGSQASAEVYLVEGVEKEIKRKIRETSKACKILPCRQD